MGLHGAFAKITDPALQGKSEEHLLYQKGRTWILITIYAHLNSLFYNQVSPISADFELTKKQCDILRNSPTTHPQVDACLACHAHLFALLGHAQHQLHSKQGSAEACKGIEEFLGQLESWWIYWSSEGEHSPFSTKDVEYVYSHYGLRETELSCVCLCRYFLTAYQLAQLFICVYGCEPCHCPFHERVLTCSCLSLSCS